MKQINTRAAAQWLLENSVIIDTETTGLSKDARVMELAAVAGGSGTVIINTLIECNIEPEPEALALHGITSDQTFGHGRNIDKQIEQLEYFAFFFKKYQITSFNQAFDIRLINQSLSKNATPLDLVHYVPELGHPACIMELANRHFHQYLEWDFEQSKFKRLRLAKCCEIAGIEFTGQAHRALPDAIAARDLLVAIAEGRV